MRTTLNVDDEVMRQVKQRAAATGRTVTAMVEMALRELLAREQQLEGGDYELRWVVVSGGAQSGADIADRDALYERMEGRA